MEREKPCPVFDADSHVYESPEIWTEFLDAEYRVPARSSFLREVDHNGIEVILVNGVPVAPLNGMSRINRRAVYRPGMTPQEIGSLDPTKPHPATEGAADAAARLADMDAMGIDQALLLPTLFSEYLPVVENADVAFALARAYNDWILDFSRKDPARLIPAAVLPMQHPAFALREAQRVAGMGFRAVAIRPSFYRTRMPNAPEYQPVWMFLNASGVAACMVPSGGGTNPEWTSEGAFIERVASELYLGHPLADTAAPWMDNGIFLSALCFTGHMQDYPNLKLGYLHSGSYWAPLVLEKSETYLWLQPQRLRPVSLEPSEVFYNRPSLVGFDTWESCVHRMPDLYENVGAWGSRYPRHDASDAYEAIDRLQKGGLSGDQIAGLMGGNAARFFGVEVAAAAA